MITGIITWVLSKLSGGLVDKVLDAVVKTEDIRIRSKEIDSETTKEALKTYIELQKIESTKWSFPWFPIMAAPFIASIGLFFLTLTAYNVFWHSDGIWPQTWTIAAYPGVYQEWATQAFNFIFAPALGAVAIKNILK